MGTTGAPVIKADYLVVGAGATSMAFVDTLLHHSDASVAIVDRRDAVGGHWNDAYPFVRLHQPAYLYGVASLPFGGLEPEPSGPNQGFASLASGTEVLAHFHRFSRDTLAASGRVRLLPMTEYRDGQVVSLLSGETHPVEVGTVVDATLNEATIPLTHQRPFVVDDDARCVAPNHLVHAAPHASHFAVLGGGKTAFDVVLWLLGNGVPDERITWVRPREAWLYERSLFQPGADFMPATADALARLHGAMAAASSVEDLGAQLEAARVWTRLDPDSEPSMFHGATVSDGEVRLARSVRDVVRGARVKAVEPDRLVLDSGDHPVPAGTLAIDCTAAGLGRRINMAEPVFTRGRIALQVVRQYQPTFSAALIGYLAATEPDVDVRNSLTRAAPMTDTVRHWAEGQLSTLANQAAWAQHPGVRRWMAGCRLDLASSWNVPEVSADQRRAAIGTFLPYVAPAAANLARLLRG